MMTETSLRIKMFLGPVNAMKQTVGPDRNKRMRYRSFIATF